MKDKKVTENGQHGCRKGKSCLTNMIASHSETIDFLEERRAADVACFDFLKVFNIVFYNID